MENKTPKTINDIIIQFADQKFTNLEFIAFLAKTSKYISVYKTDSEMLEKMYDQYLNYSLIEYEKTQLPNKYPEFKALLKEYRDGILLFDISDQMIWSKAIKDTAGLKSFYEKNKS